MLEGLKEVKKSLEKMGIRFVLKYISPELGLIDISKKSCEVILDRGYLKIQRNWRKKVADKIKCRLIQIESDVVIPVDIVSNKEEYAAYTIRNKINKKLNNFLTEILSEKYKQKFIENDFDSIEFNEISLNKFDNSVKPVENFIGGTSEAIRNLKFFLKEKNR